MELSNVSDRRVLVLVVFFAWFPGWSLATAPSKPPLTTDWVRLAKFGDHNHRLWKYQGALYDPLDGRTIAQVEGLELAWQRPSSSQENLEVDSLLQNTNATYKDALTVFSQKVFCYTTPKTTTSRTSESSSESSSESISSSNDKDNDSCLLQEIRVRPNSPRKRIPLDQAVSLYQTATTFISRNNDNDDLQEELLVHSEWPSGKSMWGKASIQKVPSSQQQQQNDDNMLEWTIYTKPRSKKSRMYRPNLIPDERKTKSNKNEETGVVISPERAALIQFGSSNMEEAKHRFGARETYSWKNVALPSSKKQIRQRRWWQPAKSSLQPQPATVLKYTRYGEGPPFYAPNRMCMLELQATPIEHINQAPSSIQRLLHQDIQGWGKSDKASSFRRNSLQLLLPEPDTWIQRKQKQALDVWERLRKATSIVPSSALSASNN